MFIVENRVHLKGYFIYGMLDSLLIKLKEDEYIVLSKNILEDELDWNY